MHHGSQSCRDCTLMALRGACLCDVGVEEAHCGSGAPTRRVLIVSLGSHLYLCHLG